MNSGKRFRRITAAALCVCMAAMLSGCGGGGNEEKPAAPTLPPANVSIPAPDGDRAIRPARDYTVYAYLPEKNTFQLTPIVRHVSEEEGSGLQGVAETLVQSLMDAVHENREEGRKLDLFHEEGQDRQPVEISNGICTVNLAPSAGTLKNNELYWLSVALATTLCGLDEIDGVNVLVADQAVGLDSSGKLLPMGTLSGHTEGENLPGLWEHMEARKAPIGSDGSGIAFSADATVYYPLAEGRGIACVRQAMNFSGQKSDQLAEELIGALSRTMKQRSGDERLPELENYLLNVPVVTQRNDGDQSVSIIFRENIQELLDRWNTDLPCLIAAVTCTVFTFVPRVKEVSVRIGETPVTEMSNRYHSSGTILSGVFHRSDAAAFLTGCIRVFFEKDGKLILCEKPTERERADSPRAMLEALLEGPDRLDRENGVTATLPAGAANTDILNIAADGDILLVKLSTDFLAQIRESGAEKETLLCYSMVNTLCLNTGMKRVCFFFGDEQAETIAGVICWSGEFIYNPSL